ncbi:regulator of chromosome condensation and btb domain protein 1 [Ichthyophthirius multifiliis]|uniref:Regulator of chromosome condensation and btb domain protein 1 n=1 Tax=Ichthyophthirius multifiliis TaxID=5932 RepID=G0QRC8_ICHMU|nr:regulator of chromosome condensation and btb domain protein 1 [Ichthyophthirius multifiliis]EGR32226.1 regulator of chromosome condensation and btb domain protein 1 [Ichthyophthirius multifiliis]|eukprot:XP_004035712.1 regulator of chromosome condensation and btb domain protein 1 [Ichthyophthirius multifiliis]
MQLSQLTEFSKSFNPLIAAFEPILINKNIENNIVTDMAAGEEFTVIVTQNQQNDQTEVFSCGHNNKGELGVGNLSHLQDITKISSLSNYQFKSPKGQLDHIKINKICCGYHHCIAALNIGVIAEWGDNDYGQLGNNKRSFSENPIIMNYFSKEKILKVQCGKNVSSVICQD